MAKAKAKDNKGPKKPGKVKYFVITLLMGLSLCFIMPTFILVMVGMIPTFVALFADTDPNRSSTSAVGAMNCAGVTPFVIDLWMKGQTLPNALAILKEPTTWLVMLGAAGIGQLIMFAVPQATATLTLIQAESRLKLLNKNLDTLKQSWGDEVASSKPLDQIIKQD